MADSEWEICIVDEVREWIDKLDDAAHKRVVQALDALAEGVPGLGRPLVDTISGSSLTNLKELRPGTVRVLFVFDPWRSSIMLVGGDKRDHWRRWYEEAVPQAEQRYAAYVEARSREEKG